MARCRFRTLAHTADVRLAVWGNDESELTENAVRGVVRLALGRTPRGAAGRWHAVGGLPGDLGRRIARVVNEALFCLYVHREIAVEVDCDGATVRLGVAPLAPGRAPEVEVKAATLHALTVARERGRLRCTLTLDL